jgi:putative transposase
MSVIHRAHPEVIVHPWYLCKNNNEMADKACDILRGKGLDASIKKESLENFRDYFKWERVIHEYNVILEEWNHDKDHIHLLFRANPNSEISKFINAYKSASSRLIKREFPAIRKELWKEYFWSRSFCLITTGGAPIDVVRKYIEEQGMKRGE